MYLNYRRIIIPLILSITALLFTASAKPNIILILADDMGWGDAGFNGCQDIPTPHMDEMAADGVIFSQGYSAHPYCSPSRAGVLTGRYQFRFGHDNNIPYEDVRPEDGLPLSETLISNVLQDNGYATAAIGKWHLGDHKHFWPNERGFDYWYGFPGGSRDYWGQDASIKRDERKQIFRNGKLVSHAEQGYLTDDFSKEAVKFIEKNKDNPFFIYLAYNAPHSPIHATQDYIDMVDHIENGRRSAYGAMVAGMDAGIGEVIAKLDELDISDNTIVIFYSDNGAMGAGASSYPYRGFKGMLYEGGIREPFAIKWPNKIKAGQVYEKPIIAYDLFPTILQAAEIEKPINLQLDGKDLLPFLNGNNKDEKPHETLFWRYSGGKGYAVRHGDFKLVKEHRRSIQLFNMKNDELERTNLASQMPDKLAQLQKLYEKWNSDMVPPKWEDPHIPNVIKTQESILAARKRASAGENK